MTAEREPGDEASLRKWLAYLYPDPSTPCRCEHAYTGLGRLHGLDMGKGWVRTTTHPYCPHHGTAAQKAKDQRRRSRAS